MNKTDKIFVVINLGWLGDTLLSDTLCRDIKLNYPSSTVIFIVSKPFMEVAKGMEAVDEVYYYDKKNEHKGVLGAFKFAKKFPYKNKVDCAFILHAHERSIMVSCAIGAKARVCAPIKGFLFNMLITHKRNYTVKEIRNTYKADFNAKYLSCYDKNARQTSKLSYCYPNEYDRKAEQYFAEYKSNDRKIIGICPLAKDEWRSFSPEFVADFIDICASDNIKIMLVGAGKVSDFVKEVRKFTQNDFIDMTNKTTIFELAAFINACDVFLSVDTGPMHISYATGQKTVCAFYKKSMIEEWAPKSFSNAIILSNEDEKITPQLCFQNCKKFIEVI